MSTTLRTVRFLVVLGLITGLACVTPSSAGEKKSKFDAAAEAKQAAQEQEDQEAARAKGVHAQKVFQGTYLQLTDGDKEEQPNPAVLGSFVTSAGDLHPGKAYLVKVADGKQNLIKALTQLNGKKVIVQGTLRNSEKYLIVDTVEEAAASTPPPKRRGGI